MVLSLSLSIFLCLTSHITSLQKWALKCLIWIFRQKRVGLILSCIKLSWPRAGGGLGTVVHFFLSHQKCRDNQVVCKLLKNNRKSY